MELVKTQFVRLLLLLVLPDRCAGDMHEIASPGSFLFTLLFDNTHS